MDSKNVKSLCISLYSEKIFHIFRFVHFLFSAIVTTAMFWRNERKFLKAAIIGLICSAGVCGISDMERVIEVARFFGIETKIVINKHNLSFENTATIEKICSDKKIDIAGYIPFSIRVQKSIVQAIPYVEFSTDTISEAIRDVWININGNKNTF
ncbi:MAG: hypothetical protein NC830_05470 [Candidatus Omnitrophica bacterium]|nr:hypothetical protein [Candidatus Omnitrophota bacterium]